MGAAWERHAMCESAFILRITTRHISALVNTPQTLNNFNSHNFNNYQYLPHIYITKIILTEII